MQIFRDNQVHVSTVGDNGVIIVGQDTSFEMGTPVDTTRVTFTRNTYPANYNHVVRNMNTLIKQTREKKKRSMRGGHFFLYRYMVFLAFLLSFAFGIASLYVKACSAVPFTLAIIYILLSIYNIVIYRLNRRLIHPDLAIYLPPGNMPRSNMKNMFYTVPLRTHIQTGAIGAFIDPARIVAAVQLENTRVDNIDVMFYTNSYIPLSKFPKECAFYLILYFLMLIFAFGCVVTTINS